MVMALTPGVRLRSAACDTEVIVVRATGEEADVRCAGAPMVPLDDEPRGVEPMTAFDLGTVLGKRYVTADETIELLCTKAGAGSLSLGEEPLAVKGAKPLPSSD